MGKLRAWLIVAAYGLAGPACAQRDVLAEYQQRVRMVLREVYARDIVALMVIEPSFATESAVGVRRREGRYAIVFLQSPVRLWNYSVVDQSPPDPKTIKAVRCEAPLEASLAAPIVAAWIKVTRLNEPKARGLDGVTFFVAAKAGGKEVTRELWSPDRGTPEAKLVTIAATMRKLCMTPNDDLRQELQSELKGFGG